MIKLEFKAKEKVNVESYSKVAEIGQILKDMDFPADKNKIISSPPNNKHSQTTKIKRIYFQLCKILKSENTERIGCYNCSGYGILDQYIFFV